MKKYEKITIQINLDFTLCALSDPWALVISEYPYIIRYIAWCKTTWAFQRFQQSKVPSGRVDPVRSGSTSLRSLSRFFAFSWRATMSDTQRCCLQFSKKNSNRVANTTWYDAEGSSIGWTFRSDDPTGLLAIISLMYSTCLSTSIDNY